MNKIGEGVLPQVLRDLYLARKTGLLHFRLDKRTARVCFIRGHIVWGDSTDPECWLGPVLVRHGVVTAEVFAQARGRVDADHRLGEILIQQFGVEARSIETGLALHVREILLAAFSWHEASFEFEEHEPGAFARYDRPLAIATGDLILDAVWSVTNLDVIRYSLGSLDRKIRPSSDPLLRYQRLDLTPIDGFLLSRIDGTSTAREAMSTVPGDDVEVLRGLFGLLCTGIVEWAEEEPDRRVAARRELPTRDEVVARHRDLDGRTHFAVLGIDSDATQHDVQTAFDRLARRFHPDGGHDPTLLGLQPALEAVFQRLAEAHRVLSHPGRRADYQRLLAAAARTPAPLSPPVRSMLDEAAQSEMVENVYARAEEEFEHGRFWDALQILETMPAGASADQLRRTRMLRARIYAKNPSWLNDARQELLAITEADPTEAEAYYLLGQVYRQGGSKPAAAAMFRKVLALKPRHAGARAVLKALEEEDPSSGRAGGR
jgi:curved DNA-binding protein CbpA